MMIIIVIIIISVYGTHFCQKLRNATTLVPLVGLGKSIEINYLIGSRTRDLPACSLVA
jgi:hypothetical protein